MTLTAAGILAFSLASLVWPAYSEASSLRRSLVMDGDDDGHPFHGNQYIDGISGAKHSIAAFCKGHLSQGMAPAKVAELAQKAYGSKTSAASVAWYKSQMTKEAKGLTTEKPKMSMKEKVDKMNAKLDAKEAAAKAAAAKLALASVTATTPVAPENYIGSKSFANMTSKEKSEGLVEATAVLKEPEKYHPDKVTSAKVFLEKDAQHQLAMTNQKAAEAKAAAVATVKTYGPTENDINKDLKLSYSEHQAVLAYSGSAYLKINSSLRAGKTLTPGPQATVVEKLDATLQKAVLEKDLKIYRGMDKAALAKAFPDGEIHIGQLITDKAFGSSSLSESTAYSFAKGAILHISAPKGANALDMRTMSRSPHEKEVLLPRDAKLRVEGVLFKATSQSDVLHLKVTYVA